MATAPVASRIPPAFRQRLLTPIGAETASALRSFNQNGLLRTTVSEQTATDLVDNGYATASLGGLKLSDTGQIRAAMENGQ